MARVAIILVLLYCVSCLAEKPETDNRYKDHALQQDWSMFKPQDTRDSNKQVNLEDLFQKFYKSDNGIISQEAGGKGEQDKGRRGGDDSKTPMRRAGCQVFFWKSWTSC